MRHARRASWRRQDNGKILPPIAVQGKKIKQIFGSEWTFRIEKRGIFTWLGSLVAN
jgi:hypothetical protein